MPLPSFTRLATIAVAFLLGAALVVSTRPVVASGNSITFTASDDTTVEQSNPSRAFGNDSALSVDGSPVQRSLLRFNVSGVPADAQIASARLRLYVNDTSVVGGYVHSVDGAWSESTTWNDAPAVGSEIASIGEATTRGAWVETDVTRAVAGNGVFDLYITTDADNGADYASSETARAPQLVVEWNHEQSATPTPSSGNPAPVVTGSSGRFAATADTTVDKTRASRSYGGDSELRVDGSPLSRGLLRFNVTGIPSGATLKSATLRLFVDDTSTVGGDVHRVGGSWSESTTWNNAPSVGSQLASIGEVRTRSAWVDVNVTSAVAGNGTVDLYILSSNANGADYASSESERSPELLVTWSAPSNPPTTVTPAPSPIASTRLTLLATEDAHVAGFGNQNFGNETTLEVDGDPSRRSLLRFSVPSSTQVASARLRLYVTESSSTPGAVHRVSGGWSEGSVTGSNAPALGAEVTRLPAATRGRWLEVDVTPAVAPGQVSFYLASNLANGVDFSSSESSQKPELVVTTTSGGVSVPTVPSAPGASITPTPAPSPVVTPTPTATPTAAPTPTATATPAPSKPGCAAIPSENLSILSERSGFGRNVNGGAGGCLYVVTNDNDSGPGSLRDGATRGDRWVVFADDFHIRLNSQLDVASNTTIDGRGQDVTISGATIRLKGSGYRNLILHNLTIKDSSGGDDLLHVGNGASHFWFHHLTMSNSSDEYIDISRSGSDGIYGTISWTRFDRGTTYSTELVILIGDNGGDATNHFIHVTLHHNWFNGTSQRHPSANGSRVHSYNNFIQWRLWGIQARHNTGDIGAQVVSQNDVFDAQYAFNNNIDDGVALFDSGNAVRVENPLLLNRATYHTENSEDAFKPQSFYSYSLDPTSSVIDSVTAGAGVR